MSNSPWTALCTPKFRLRRSQPTLRLLSILLLTALAADLLSTVARAQTFTLNDSSAYTATPIGVNMGGQDYYSTYIQSNWTMENPGFEGEETGVVEQAASTGTTTTFTSMDTCDQVPPNFFAGGTYYVAYSVNAANEGKTGSISANTGPNNGGAGCNGAPEFTLSTPLPDAISEYDVIFVYESAAITNCNWSYFGWTCGGTGNGTAAIDTASGDQFSNGGSQNIKMTLTSANDTAYVQTGFDSEGSSPGEAPNVYLNGTYTWCVETKLVSGSGVTLTMSGSRTVGSTGTFSAVASPAPSSTAQESCATFTLDESSSNSPPAGAGELLYITLSGPGAAQVLIDNSNLTSNNDTELSLWRNQIYSDVVTTMDAGSTRLWYGQNGASFANMTAPPLERHESFSQVGGNYPNSTAGVNPGGGPFVTGIGLGEFLTQNYQMGIPKVHFVLPITTTPAEMTEYTDFISAPCSAETPGSEARCNNWQSTPFSSQFTQIDFSIGNEEWNYGAQGQNWAQGGSYCGSGAADSYCWGYIQYVNTMCQTMKADSYYNSVLKCSATIQTGNTYAGGFQTMLNSSYVDFADLNEYGSGMDITDPDTPDQWTSAWTDYWIAGNNCTLGGTEFCQSFALYPSLVYEYNNNTIGTYSGTQAELEGYANGEGYGLVDALGPAWLQYNNGNFTSPAQYNLFQLFQNNIDTGNGLTNYIWGIFTGPGGANNNPRPPAEAIGAFNRCIGSGDTGYAISYGSIPTYNFAGYNGVEAQDNIPLVQAFAFKNGSNRCIALFNLDSSSHTVTFAGTNPPSSGTCTTVTYSSSGNLSANNEISMEVNLATTTPTCSASQTIPAYTMETISYSTSSNSTSTTLTASPTSGSAGQNVTLTATVASQTGSTTPTGTVTFLNGATTLGTASLNASGVATFSTTTLPAGTDSITASYGGDSNDAGSTSSAVTVDITSNIVQTTTSLTASATQINTGQSVSFTATVAPQSGTTAPTGTVTFLSETGALGSATLNANGTATFSTSALTAGADSITASYGGSSSDASSVSSAVTVNVTQTVVATTTTLLASAVQITSGQSVVLTATVTPVSGSTTPTGTVTFLNGATTLGTATLNASGTASLSTTTLPAGVNSITASYGGSAGNSSSSSTAVTITVTQALVATTTTLASSATQVNTGQSVTFTAKVTPQTGTTTPTGTVTFLNGLTILGTGSLTAGTATFSTTALPAGSDPITASYGGSTANSSSVSAAVTVTVTQTLVSTTTSLSASATQVNTGQSVTFTALVSPASGSTTPTGTVTFFDGTTTLGTGTLNASGAASFSTSSLAAGAQSITASYGGSTTNSSSVSAPVVVTVTQTLMATTTALSSSATAINSGQSVTLTAKVSPQSGVTIPTGVVTFFDGSTVLGTGTLNASATATLSTASLPVGTDSITAGYGGSASDSSSTSGAVVVTVTQSVAATTTTLTASALQITSGQTVDFTVTVSAQSGGNPSGTVTLMDGTTQLGTVTLNGGGRASYSTSALAAGPNTITASYGGSADDSASTSAAVTITVAAAPVETNTVLSASSTAINTGQSVTFTATVTPQTGSTPVAQLPVAFLNGSAIIGTATTNASGVAVFTTTALRAGADSITASYTGNNTDLSSVSKAVVVNVTQTVVSTTTSLVASATQLTTGQGVTLTATVSPSSGTTAAKGTVTFLDGATSLGTGTLNSSGAAFLDVTTLSAGSHTITASYGGSTSDSASVSAPVVITVSQSEVATSTSLTSSATAISTGQSVTFTAKVSPQSGSAIPSGAVAFVDGSGILGTATLNASGVAAFSTTFLPAGEQSIVASYQGSSSDSSSTSSPVSVNVTQTVINTTTSLVASATQIDTGDDLVLTATVAPQTGSTTPSGTVTFFDGTTALGTVSLTAVGANGTAFFATTTLAAGSQTFTASYNGSASDAKSVSSSLQVVVTQSVAATTTSLTASTTALSYGQNATFTATVTARSGGVPAGTVYLVDGGTIVSSAQLNANGAATFNTDSLAIGDHAIVAAYGGSSSDSSSYSAAIDVEVSPDQDQGGASAIPTKTSLAGSQAQLTLGQNVTFTATVTAPAGSAIPNGTVTFLDGSATLGSAVLTGGSTSFSTTNLPQGTNLITAVYDGNTTDLVSISQVLTIVVTAPTPAPITGGPAIMATTTTLTASATQVTSGQPVSFSASVTPQSGSGIPTGTVIFLDGQTALGTATLNGSGVAVFSTTQLATGTYSVSASYGGDASNAPSTSAPITVTVASSGTPGYTMTVSNSDVSVTPGQVANLTVTLTPVNGFNMPVTLTCSGMPEGTSCSFAPPTLTPDGAPVSSTLSILVSGSMTSAQNRAPGGGKLAFGLVMPWGLVSLLGLSKRKNRSRVKGWTVRLVVTAALIAGSLWMSGCGYSVNGSVFTMTLTAAGKNVPTQTSQITVSIAP